MQITIKYTLNVESFYKDKSIAVNVESFDKLIDVKYKIYEKEGILPDGQQLVFLGKLLNDNFKALEDYNIQDNSMLGLVVGYIDIFVKTLTRKMHVIKDIKYRDTIGYLKAKIESMLGYPVDEQRLIFAGSELEDGRTLGYYDIRRGSTLHLLLPKSRDMQLTIKAIWPEESIALNLKSYSTLLDVKYKIQEKWGVPHDEQRYITLGRELKDDDKTLADYNIQNKSSLCLVVRSMHIFVQTLSGKRLVVRGISYLQTIGYVKDKLKDMEGKYPVNLQRLIFGRYELEDDKTLAYYDIHRGSTIQQLLYLRPGMQIFVNTITGKSITLEVEGCDTIATVKAKVHDIQEKERIAHKQQWDLEYDNKYGHLHKKYRLNLPKE